MRVTVLGTGLMGAPMARRLLAGGLTVTVWNRTQAKAEALVTDGATLAETPADAVAGAAVIVSMLADGAATADLLRAPDLKEALPRGAVWVDMASARPQEACALADSLAPHGVACLDAPVSGGTAGARDGTLAIMVGGDEAAFATARPVLDPLGRPVLVGPVGAGMLAKLANQAIVGITIGAVAEAMRLLEAGGADPAAVRDALKGGFADGTVLQMHGARMTHRDFTPGGTCATQLKDMRNVTDEAGRLGLSLPMSTAVRDRYAALIAAQDAAGLDHAALFLDLLDDT